MARVNGYVSEFTWQRFKEVQATLIRRKQRLFVTDKHGNRVSRLASSNSTFITRAIELLCDILVGEPEKVLEVIYLLRPDVKELVLSGGKDKDEG